MEDNNTNQNNNSGDKKFEAITSQEQLYAIIKDRLDRASKKHSEATAELQKELDSLKTTNTELSGKLSDYEKKYANVDAVISDLQGKVKSYETDSVKTRVAREYGIPWELRDRLRGDTEEEIRNDARALSEILPKNSAPRKSSDTTPANGDEHKEALRETARRMFNKND